MKSHKQTLLDTVLILAVIPNQPFISRRKVDQKCRRIPQIYQVILSTRANGERSGLTSVRANLFWGLEVKLFFSGITLILFPLATCRSLLMAHRKHGLFFATKRVSLDISCFIKFRANGVRTRKKWKISLLSEWHRTTRRKRLNRLTRSMVTNFLHTARIGIMISDAFAQRWCKGRW